MSSHRLDHETLQIVAPCDLNAGFTFLARTASGDDLPVTVPKGGVAQGQTFCVAAARLGTISPSSIMASSFTNLTELTPLIDSKATAAADQSSASSYWKDPLGNCCRSCSRQSRACSVWSAFCCPWWRK